MAAREKITFDKTEICVLDTGGKRPVLLNLTYEKITSIQFDHGKMRKFMLMSVPSDKISIQVRGKEEPVVLYAAAEPDFNKYVEGLRKFAKENRVTLHDHLVSV